jgi:iron-sulfur cluster assembly protein
MILFRPPSGPQIQELTTMSVRVTETAAREICSIIKQQELDPEKIRLRVGVKGGGCSGFSYLLDLTETQRDTDEVWEFTYTFPKEKSSSKDDEKSAGASDNGSVAVATDEGETFTLYVICDPKSYLYLNNTEIDFKDEIMGRGFVFNNPNATATCGCGSSFSA